MSVGIRLRGSRAMTSSLPEIKLLTGPQAALHVPLLWDALTPQRRRYAVWDAGKHHGPTILSQLVSLGNIACAAWLDGSLLGIAWVIPVCQGSRCGLIHMLSTGERWQAEAIGNVWIRNVVTHYYDSLLAFLPVPFRHIRSMIEDMGFREISRLPGGSCLTMRNNRITTAVLYQKDLLDEDS